MEKEEIDQSQDPFTMIRVRKSIAKLVRSYRINRETYEDTLKRLLTIENNNPEVVASG